MHEHCMERPTRCSLGDNVCMAVVKSPLMNPVDAMPHLVGFSAILTSGHRLQSCLRDNQDPLTHFENTLLFVH